MDVQKEDERRKLGKCPNWPVKKGGTNCGIKTLGITHKGEMIEGRFNASEAGPVEQGTGRRKEGKEKRDC